MRAFQITSLSPLNFVQLFLCALSFQKVTQMSWPEDHAGWHLTKTTPVDCLGCTSLIYHHSKHQCPFWILNVFLDPNIGFAVIFKTFPRDNSGVLYILEHLVLHGSEKYPIIDVYTELRKRSYANEMNAYMSDEWMLFTFYSMNETDFHHCLDVYLDCSFHARFTAEGFEIEGHRLEFEDNDTSKPLKHSGVVYTE